MSFINDFGAAVKEQGVLYTLKQAPTYLKWVLVDSKLSKIYNPYGTISREEMKGACELTGDIWYYGSRLEFEIPPPLTGQVTEQIQEYIGVHEVPESFVCEVQNVELIGDQALVRADNGRYLVEEMGTESTLESRLLNTSTDLTVRQRLYRIISRDIDTLTETNYDTILNLVPRHGREEYGNVNFGHWILEDLPRLRAYDHYHDNTGRKPTLLLKQHPPSWMIETLELLGYSSSDWVVWDGRPASVSRLVVPKLSYVHSWGPQYQPSDRQWVSEQMKSRIDLTAGEELPERVFISRQNRDRRYVDNFDEVMSKIRSLGFESVCPEELSISDQIRLFDRAEIVVGATGSAFANLIFSSESTLLQIVPEGAKIPPWYVITAEQGLEYDYMFAEPVDPDSINKDSNMTVDVDKLAARLEKLIDRTGDG